MGAGVRYSHKRNAPTLLWDVDDGGSAGRIVDFGSHYFGSTVQRRLALDSTGRLPNLADKLVPFCKLTNLDLGLLVPIQWIEDRPQPFELDQYTNYRSYLQGTGDQARHLYDVKLKSWEEGFKARLGQAAMALLDKLPSLQSGHFWAPADARQPPADPDSWHRWSWRVVTDQEGDISIQVNEFPEIVSKRFARNRDGIYEDREDHDREYESD